MSRLTVCAVLFAASCLLLTQRTEPVAAQDKKDKNTVAHLEKQVAALKNDLQAAIQQNNALRADLQAAAQLNNTLKAQNATLTQQNGNLTQQNAGLKTTNTRLNAIIAKENIVLPAADQTIKTLQAALDGYRGAGLVHVVVLKLKSASSSGETQSLIDDAYAQLTTIKVVRGLWAGKPAAKGTPDAVTDYTVALVLLFDDAAGLKTYLNDPVHTKFADRHLKRWETPTVYDFEPKKPAP
jgi:hypothetical protein